MTEVCEAERNWRGKSSSLIGHQQRNLFNRSSGVQIPRDICTRFGRYLYSTRCSWIIRLVISRLSSAEILKRSYEEAPLTSTRGFERVTPQFKGRTCLIRPRLTSLVTLHPLLILRLLLYLITVKCIKRFSNEYCNTKTKPVTYQLDYSAILRP